MFKIKDRELTQQNPYIIAEVGSNWKDFVQAKDSIALAKNCGADAVKFQLFDHEALFGWEDEVLPGQMPLDWIPKLKEKADAVGIEFMCTAFGRRLLDYVDQFVDVHKIASSNMADLKMLDKIISVNKPIFLSTGGWPHGDVEGVVKLLKDAGFDNFCLMYTIGSYPAQFVNWKYFNKLKSLHPYYGFSDHTTNIYPIPAEAVNIGSAIAVEKHFNPFDLKDTADAPHSLNTDGFKIMIKGIRNQLTENDKAIDEKEMREKHLIRIVAISDIKAGETLIEGKNFGAFRSKTADTTGAHPSLLKRMENRACLVNKERGQGISARNVGL